MDKKALLEWYADAGVDEAIGDAPVNQLVQKMPEPKTPSPGFSEKPAVKFSPAPKAPANPALLSSPSAAAASSRALADQCLTLEDLKNAVEHFDGCAIKKTASRTVFADGNPKATVMVIGEAPGAQEDIQGIPFCGPSGQLLDKMLSTIGLTRKDNLYISNTVFWRPPGNRQPTPEETAICRPFVEKHIALIKPRLLLLAGGTATTALLNQDVSISRLRGKFYEYTNPYLPTPISVGVTYHPSYLMRSPGQKRLAWADMLLIQEFLG